MYFSFKRRYKMGVAMNYRLLRSNKETGPYNLDQLVQLGLKPYDLVWIEGKSAAWRYPSEVDELKYYAPTVEEQPYDRFYKKGTQEKHYFESLAEQNKDSKQTIKQHVEANPVQFPVEPKYELKEQTEIKHYEIAVEKSKEVNRPIEIKRPLEIKKYYAIPAIPEPENKHAELIKPAEEIHYQIPENKKPQKKPVAVKYYEIPVIPKPENKPTERAEEIHSELIKPAEEIIYQIPVEQKPESFNPYDVKQFEAPVENKQNDLKPVETGKKGSPGKVFVSMPEKSNSYWQKENKPVKTVSQPHPEKIAEKSIFEEKKFGDEKVELKEEYSQSLDEIKRMYAENYLERKHKISRKQSLVRFFQAAGIAACAIGLGALAYFVFLPGKKDDQLLNLAEISQSQTGNSLPDNSETQPSSNRKQVKYQGPGEKTNTAGKKVQTAPTNDDIEEQENQTGATGTENNQGEIVPDENAAGGKTEIDPVTGQRNKTTRSDNGEVTKSNTGEVINVRSTAVINKFVSVKANNYVRKAFGGIQDLQLTVSNGSKFILDQVSVELLYLKPSEQPLKTEIIRFTDVAPNGTMTIKIPDSQRGIKVSFKVLEVESSQFDKHLAGM